mgnify:CR=1 FL=1
MSDLNIDNMDNMDFDVLREIGNIGAGNATTALSQLINAKVEMKVPKVEMLEFKEISEILGGAERLVAGILITLQGQAEGMMMFVLDQDSAHHLVNILLGKSVDNFDDFTDMELSALNEIGNIIAGAYLSSLSALTNLTITSSVPYMAIDMAGAILSVPAIEFGKIGDKALLIQSQFGEEDQYINGYFILIPTLESYNLILSSLGL